MKTKIKVKLIELKSDCVIFEKFAWFPKKIVILDEYSKARRLINYYWIWLEKYKENKILYKMNNKLIWKTELRWQEK